MRTKISIGLLSTLLLGGCNSSSVMDSMDGIKTSSLTRSSDSTLTPAVAVDSQQALVSQAEQPRLQQEPIAYSEFDTKTEVPSPVITPTKTPVQVASVRPQTVKPAIKKTTRRTYKRPKIYKAKFSDRKPIDFGRAAPRHFAVHGVDVSRWQYDIDWKQLRKRGANFAFIKATEGGDHKDPMFRKNWDAAEKAGVPRGAYHFFYWCRVAEEQADWFIQNVPKDKGALPPVIDVEWNNHSKTCPRRPSREVVLKKMKVFMRKVEKHYGQKPIIYTAPDFYEDNLKGQFKDYPFWLRSVAAHPKKRYPNRDFVFWQYSGTGLSKGHGTEIDLNVFNGSKNGWYKWLGRNVY